MFYNGIKLHEDFLTIKYREMKAEEFIPKNSNGKYSRNEIVQWAEKYHEAELKKLRVADVSGSVCDSEWHESNIQHFGECIACGLNVDDF